MEAKHTEAKHARTFKMRISEEDNEYFEQLAKRLSRSKSDALRFMARLWVEAMKAEDAQKNTIQTDTSIHGI